MASGRILCRTASQSLVRTTVSPADGPGALLAIDVTSVRLPSHSHAANQDAGNATTPEVICSVMTRPCASSVVRHSPQRRHNQRANKGRQNHQDNQRQMVVIPFPACEREFVLVVEDDENHPKVYREVK